jgi:hypothetical protein
VEKSPDDIHGETLLIAHHDQNGDNDSRRQDERHRFHASKYAVEDPNEESFFRSKSIPEWIESVALWCHPRDGEP